MIEALLYLQVDFLKYQNLIQTAQQFEKVLFSPDFYVENEEKLSDIILNKIEEDQEFLSLVQFIHFDISN
jgi:hypothetical protein